MSTIFGGGEGWANEEKLRKDVLLEEKWMREKVDRGIGTMRLGAPMHLWSISRLVGVKHRGEVPKRCGGCGKYEGPSHSGSKRRGAVFN